MLIGLTLFCMFVVTMFSMFMGNIVPGSVVDSSYDTYLVVNGTKSYVTTVGETSVFFIDPVLGAMSILVVVIALVVVMGIRIFGNGLSDESIRIATICIIYGGVWTVLSILALPLISLIEVFGALMYVGLTIGYIVGVVERIGGVSR